MKKHILALLMVGVSLGGITRQTSFKFDFGSDRTAKGYIGITPASQYNDLTGYGFSPDSKVIAVDRGGKALKGDFITADAPFYFSVKLPEGNYDVKLILGDAAGTSATTVRAECRRLMLENIKTTHGQITTQAFTVHVKDSLIRKANGVVSSKLRLKPREFAYLHWDNLLTIEFNDSMPKVCAMEISPDNSATTIFLAGNSTVVDQDKEPWAAWGQMFSRFLKPGTAAVANYAESGETMKAFKGERRLEKIWSMSKPGDYLLMEFTHNDQKPGGNHLDPFTTYMQTLKEWIAEAKKRNLIPVLVTSMHRRSFDSLGHINNTLLDYPEAMRQTAKAENVALIDLNAMSKVLYEAWGAKASTKAFVHFPANTFPGQNEKLEDNTHFSTYGAYSLAQCIVQSIKDQRLSLSAFLRKEIADFDPAKPMPFADFYWPPSPFLKSRKPDGN